VDCWLSGEALAMSCFAATRKHSSRRIAGSSLARGAAAEADIATAVSVPVAGSGSRWVLRDLPDVRRHCSHGVGIADGLEAIARRPGFIASAVSRDQLLRRGLALEYLTLGWNVVGVVVLAIAAASGSVALIGFGVDSLIEIVASAVVVWELRGETGSQRERTALRVISVAFSLLAVYIAVQAAFTFTGGASRPGHSVLGIVWLGITVVAMWCLAYGKHRTGARLGNKVLATESRVTVIDGALAATVLLGVVLNTALNWWWADPVSALILMVYAIGESRHAWREAA
jgi:hypothetical protein